MGSAILGPTGAAIVVGSALADALGGHVGSVGPMAAIAVTGGIVLIAGPGILFPALVAGVAVTMTWYSSGWRLSFASEGYSAR